MRGDQLARQWRVSRRIVASSNGQSVVEIAKLEGVLGTPREGSPSKAFSKSWDGLFCYEGRSQ